MKGVGAIGKTPVVRLERLAGPDTAEVWLKLESANPTGSYKDRMALAMIEGAERSGRLVPGQTVVEYTGGSTGSSLAFVCAVKGYPLRIGTSDARALEKTRTLQAFGVFLKYARLWEYRIRAARGEDLALPAFDDDEQTWKRPAED